LRRARGLKNVYEWFGGTTEFYAFVFNVTKTVAAGKRI